MPSRFAIVFVFVLAVAGCQDEPLFAQIGSGGARADAGAGMGGESGAATGGEAGKGGEAGEGAFVPPTWLSETGLFEDILSDTIAAGVRPFTPRFELWSDGATKRRWLWLPEGSQIDTSNMDYWHYPVGTKVWKEFTVEERRIETRLLQKLDAERWFMMAFRWNGERSDALAVPEGEENARGKQHDVPSTLDCTVCHEKMPDVLLGVTAIQLSHNASEMTLESLAAEGRLTDPPPAPFEIPGADVERGALGYLHANCGMCHQPESIVTTEVDMELWLRTEDLGSVEETPPYRTAVGKVPVLDDFPEATARIEPGDAEHSAIFLRMSSRDPMTQMPPLATELVDPDGLARVRSWIEALEAP